MGIQHAEGLQDGSTYKVYTRHLKSHTNFWTHCIVCYCPYLPYVGTPITINHLHIIKPSFTTHNASTLSLIQPQFLLSFHTPTMEHLKKHKNRRNKLISENIKAFSKVFLDFCRNTSAHGFQYWVSAGSLIERLLWIVIVACGFTFASIMVSSTVTHWRNNPSSVAINTFSKPAYELPFPAITICNENGFDIGQYIRAVFDNFQYSCYKDHNCSEVELLRSHFSGYFEEEVSCKPHLLS